MYEIDGPSQAAGVFRSLMASYLVQDGVTEGTGFGGNPGLRLRGRIFAMLAHGELVVKLPEGRATELSAIAGAHHFDAGKGRPMREWVAVAVPGDGMGLSWESLVREAFAYASSR